MKKVSLIMMALTMIIVMVLSGCSGSNSTNDNGTNASQESNGDDNASTSGNGSSSESSDEVTEIRVSWWGSETRHTNTLEAIKKFEELNPDIKIIPEYQGWEGYRDKLIAQVLAGNAPDVFSNIGEWYGELLAGNAMADITDQIDVSGHNPKYVEACSVDGVMYGVNLSVNGKIIIMNKTLMEELGVDLLEEPYTWGDLVEKSKEIYEKSNGDVYGMPDFSVTNEGMGFPMFPDYAISVLGVEGPIPYDNENYTITKDQVQSFYQWWEDQRQANVVAPADVSTVNDFSANSLLLQRAVAIEVNYAGTLARFQDQTEDELVILPFPVGENGKSADDARPGIIMSVFEQSEKKDAAIRFLDFMTNSEEAALALKTSRGVLPTEVQRNALINADGLLSENDVKVMEVVDKIMARDLRTFYSGPTGNAELSAIFVEIGQEIAFDSVTVEEGADKFMERVEELANN